MIKNFQGDIMNKRYDELNKLIKDWHKNGEQDDLILRSLYAQVALDKSNLVDRSEDLKKGTKFSNLSQEDFVSLFKTQSFNNLDKTNIKHLFQELHNRYIKGKGFDVTRDVAVVNDKSTSAYGYVCYSNDLLFINKDAIDKAKNISPEDKNFNKTNLGISLLFIIMHESQHVTQYETAIDFALNKKQDDDKAFLGAMGIIKNTNFLISDKNNDDFIKYWQQNYDYRYVEHNANYSAFEKAMEVLPEDQKKGKPFDQYNAFTTLLSLRSHSYDEKFVQDRIAKMEKVALKEIEYFEKGTADCSIKQNVMATVKEFMKVDEKGNSKFRDILHSEISKMAEVSKQAKDNLQKNSINEELSMSL